MVRLVAHYPCLCSSQDIIRKLEAAAEAERQAQREAKRKALEAKRAEVQALLKTKVDAGTVHALSKWRDFKPAFVEEAVVKEYMDLGASSPTPHDLFDEVVGELYEVFKADSKVIARVVKDAGCSVSTDTKYEEWVAQLTAHDAAHPYYRDRRARSRSEDPSAEAPDPTEPSTFALLRSERPQHLKLAFEDLVELVRCLSHVSVHRVLC